jgi:hypothetical protein
MRRKVIPLLLLSAVALVVAAAWAYWSQIEFYRLTGRFYPIRKVDRLAQPVGVTSWTETELLLADGRTAKLLGIRKLPPKSEALSEATRRGVELAPGGRVYGLVRIHHWCGNDPVRDHIARVDVSEMMLFLGEGEPISKLPPDEQGLERRGETFSKFGWDVGEFGVFETWQELRHLSRGASR